MKAECWLLAAETYAKANCLSKCLSSCTSGGHFDFGLTILEEWWSSSRFDDRSHQEIDKIRIAYLEHCARHYYEAGNINRMMTFVRAFHSMDQIRPFLNSLNLLDELFTLEVESKNYLEAAGIARDKGDFILEAEMLEKVGDLEKSCKMIISFAIVKSLWSSGMKGWPFKDFSERDELLIKAKSLAKKVSCSFYDLTCLEVEILSKRAASLQELSEFLQASSKLQNVRLEIFSIRMILDLHLQLDTSKFLPESKMIFSEEHIDNMMSQNNMCAHTLLHYWNLWKEKMSNVLSYVLSLDKPEENELSVYEDYCLTYLGVWKEKVDKYVMMDSKTSWITNKKVPVLRNKYLAWMSAKRFRASAEDILSEELLFVGLEVLDKLKALHVFSLKKQLPMFNRWMVCLSLYETAKHLKQVEFLLEQRRIEKTGQSISFCKEALFGDIFPYECRNDVSECVIDLHENATTREIIELMVDDNLKPQNGRLTHGQIGRVAMLILVIGRVPDELFKKIDDNLSSMQPWKEFFLVAQKYFSDSCSGKINFVFEFQNALRSTFEVEWKKEPDYISPKCFIYLLENLLLMCSCCNGSNSTFFTTKSLLCEFISWQSFGGLLAACSTVQDALFNNYGTLGFIADVTKGLLEQKTTLKQWMTMSSIPLMHIKSLVLRLVNILILVYLNAGWDMSQLANVLRKCNIISELPGAFQQKLQSTGSAHRHDRYYFRQAFLDAMEMAGNPLVVMCSENSCQEFSRWKAIIIESEKISSREDVLAALFPIVEETSPIQDGERPSDELCLVSNDIGEDGNSSLTCPLDEAQIAKDEHAIEDSWEKYNSFWDMLELHKCGTIGGSHGSNAGELKV